MKRAKQFITPFEYHIELTVAISAVSKPTAEITEINYTPKYQQIQFNFLNEQQFYVYK